MAIVDIEPPPKTAVVGQAETGEAGIDATDENAAIPHEIERMFCARQRREQGEAGGEDEAGRFRHDIPH